MHAMNDALRMLAHKAGTTGVFAVVAFVGYFLGGKLPQPALPSGPIEFIAVLATVGGLALGRAADRGRRNTRARALLCIVCIAVAVLAVLGYVLLGGSGMGNGSSEYVLLGLLLALAFACFGVLIHLSGLEIGEPPAAMEERR